MFQSLYHHFWHKIAKTDPYFGVLSHPNFLSETLPAHKEKFFQTGTHHIINIFKVFEQQFKHPLSFSHVLDFGCGTGRVLTALASKCLHITGVDVSSEMIGEAQKNCKERGLTNVTFLHMDGKAPFLQADDHFDLIHSVIVLQHIPPKTGVPIIHHLLSHLEPGGLAYLQFNYYTAKTLLQRWAIRIAFTFPQIPKLLGFKGKYLFPLFDYNLDEVFQVLHHHDIQQALTTFGKDGPHHFVNLFLQKKD